MNFLDGDRYLSLFFSLFFFLFLFSSSFFFFCSSSSSSIKEKYGGVPNKRAEIEERILIATRSYFDLRRSSSNRYVIDGNQIRPSLKFIFEYPFC